MLPILLHVTANFMVIHPEKAKALDYFKLMTFRTTVSHLALIQFKVWPPYDAIREEPEFREMLNIMENKYLAQHQKVKKRLTSKGIDPM
jgi:hypothetical protein